LETWALGSYEAEGFAEVVLIHIGLEVGGGFVMRARLEGAPVHKEAVAQATEHSQNVH
jgi:hypothetical protein